MKILKHIKNDLILKIEDEEDIFYLTQIIKQGDILKETIERKIKIGVEEEKNKISRKRFSVEIEVFEVLFESNTLKIKGKILSEIENLKKMSFEVLHYRVEDEIKIQKEKLFNFEKKILKKLSEKNFEKTLIVLLDKENLICFEVYGESYIFLFEKKNLGSKKKISQEINEEEEKYGILKPFLENYKKIILAGPFIFKNKLQKFLQEKNIKNIFTLNFLDVERNMIEKIIIKANYDKILNVKSLEREKNFVEEFSKNLSLSKKICYGFTNILECVEIGKIDKLLVSIDFLKNKTKEKMEEIYDIFEKVEKFSGEILFFSYENEYKSVVDNFTGICATTKY